MDNNQNMVRRKIDIVFTIDGTSSMTPCLDMVKNATKDFYQKFEEALVKNNNQIDSLRIKIIVFRDYEYDSKPMEESPFFELPMDLDDYSKYLSRVEAIGGGDNPENGLEALHYAFNSEFIATGMKDREVIVLFTDTDAISREDRIDCKYYPKDMVDENGLIREWILPSQKMKLTQKGKRLVLYAPPSTKYQGRQGKLPNCSFVPVKLGSGLVDFNFDEIIRIIAASVSN